MKLNNFLNIALILLITTPVTSVSGGKTTYDFLRNDVGARAAGLGGSFVTMSDDPNAIFYNPAGLGSLSQRRVSIGFFKHLLDINSGYVSFGTDIAGLGVIGAGVNYINYGEFRRRGEEGQDLGRFGAGEVALSACYAGPLKNDVNYGVGVKFIHSSIAEFSSSGAALDLGIQYVAVRDRMLIGASLLNLGTQFDPYGTTRESLPLDFKIGMSLYPEHLPAVLSVDFHKLNERQERFTERFSLFSVGVEFTASPNLQLRFGYNNEKRRDLKVGSSSGLAGFSAGFGLSTGMYIIDYAYTSYGQIGAVHRVSVSF